MFQACFQRIQRPRASSVSCDGFFDCLKMHPQSRPHARDVGAMASSFAARRADTVDALFAQVVERVVGVQAGEENLQIAHNYCLYHTRHHSFPDPDPRAVRDEVDALRERLGVHAQLEKQRALEMLVGRFEATPWATVLSTDVQSRVGCCCSSPQREPASTRSRDIDAAPLVPGDAVAPSIRFAAPPSSLRFATRAQLRGDRCDHDATESDCAQASARRRPRRRQSDDGVRRARSRSRRKRARRARRARREGERTPARRGCDERDARIVDRWRFTHENAVTGSRGAALGDALDAADAADARETRETRGRRIQQTRRSSPRRRPRCRRGGAAT